MGDVAQGSKGDWLMGAPNLENYRMRLGPGSKKPPFVILCRKGRRGRRRILGRPTVGLERQRGLQSIKRFAVIQCPVCHEFKIAKRGHKYMRCPYCDGRFWTHKRPILATSDDRGAIRAELVKIRARWVKQILR